MTEKELYKLIRKLTKRRLKIMRKITYGDYYGYPGELEGDKSQVERLRSEIRGYEDKLKACKG